MLFNLDIKDMHIALFLLLRVSSKVDFMVTDLMNLFMCLGAAGWRLQGIGIPQNG